MIITVTDGGEVTTTDEWGRKPVEKGKGTNLVRCGTGWRAGILPRNGAEGGEGRLPVKRSSQEPTGRWNGPSSSPSTMPPNDGGPVEPPFLFPVSLEFSKPGMSGAPASRIPCFHVFAIAKIRNLAEPCDLRPSGAVRRGDV